MNVLPRQDIKDIAQVVQEQLNKAGFKVELQRPGARPVHPGLAQQQVRPVRLDQRRQPRSGRLFLPHLPHRRLDQRVQVLERRGRRAARQRPAPASDPAARKADYAKVQKIARLRGPDRAPRLRASCSRRCASNVQGFDIIANRSLSADARAK